MQLAIHWNPDPELINLFGILSIRYYSLLFALGLLIGFYVIQRLFVLNKLPEENLETLAFYIFIGTVVGARLGHCLFYEPGYYLSHPLEMILPFSFANGNFEYTGFLGLASHGGIIGVFLAIWYFSRKFKLSILSILDIVAVAGALAASFIRLGNFMNSEIIGKATNSNYGVVFELIDDVARHPAQLYESIAYFLIFLLLAWIAFRQKAKNRVGFIFGLFFVLLFITRFIIEFFKVEQVAFEQGMFLNMGQLLSIPFMLVGFYFMAKSKKSVS